MIVITTPTGQIGRQVLDHLVGADEPVRVIARDPSRLDPQTRRRIEVVQGSSDDPDVVAQALHGADAMLWVVPPDPRAEHVEQYYVEFTRPVSEAVSRQGIQRVVGVTSLGRAYPQSAGNLSAAFAMDELIESTGVHYRALAMPFFMENLLHQVDAIRQGVIAMPNAATRPLASVATRDIAPVAARLLLDRTWSGQQSVPVISPDHLTPDAMAQVVSEVLGHPVTYQQVPATTYQQTMTQYGMTSAWAQGLVDMAAAQDDGIYDTEQATAAPQPTSFRTWCQQVLVPAVTTTSDHA